MFTVASPRRPSPQKPKSIPCSIPTDGVIPEWTSLPYEILLSIFHHASTPLRDDLLFRPKPSVNWLLNTARVCRAFKEPALATLYESPPLFEVTGPHDLLALLKADPAQWSVPYASKIKRFHVDVYRTLTYKAAGRGLIDLGALLGHMPQLAEVEIGDPSDKPPFRPQYRGKPWTYPEDLFRVMADHNIHLSRWHWNTHMMNQSTAREWFAPHVADTFEEAHKKASLNQIQELSISKLGSYGNKRIWKAVAEQNTPNLRAERMRQVLAPLRKLHTLSLISCSAFEKAWMEVLQAIPNTLRSLTISNTLLFTSTALTMFLESHGSKLKNLVLDHNQSLDLSFTPKLKEFCPHLERLHMDLTFYNQVTNYEDKDPLFDTLLLPNEHPTWPTTMQSLELYNLRQWSSDAAENFFESLESSAIDLPMLRRVIIKAILNISWRERAGFREKWITRLQRIFLRSSEDPDPALASKKAFRISRQPGKSSYDQQRNTIHEQSREGRDEGHANTKDAPGGPTRRSQRVKANEVEVEEQELTESIEVQGLCEIVDINIDNNRPAEVQYHEEDFLDSEPDEDEEWIGDVPTSEP